jgi:gas vesicle protein
MFLRWLCTGLLLRSKSGSETRKYLRSKTQEGTDYLKKQVQELADSATETIERGKRTLESQVKNFADAVGAGKQAYREAVETAQATTGSV